MNQIPQDIINHCQKHPGCKGCPLKTCEAPHGMEITDPKWNAWLESRFRLIRELAA